MSLADALSAEGLQILGTVQGADAALPAGAASLALVGPDGPRFWEVFAAAPEHADGAAHPLDRWSARVIGGIAAAAGGRALFPFGGPPWHPFMAWARASGRIHASPVGLLVHATEGLWVSFRGAILLPEALSLPPLAAPCAACPDQPCRTACPPAALTPAGFDAAACLAHVATPGTGCDAGCHVRRACPAGRGRRERAQSAFHMAAFAAGGAA